MNRSGLTPAKIFNYAIKGSNNYKHLIYDSSWKAVVFMLLLTFILGAVYIMQPVRELNSGISLFAANYEKLVPDFELRDGELHVEGEMPLILQDENITIIIDTSDNADQTILDDYDNALMFMKHQLIQKNYSNKSSTSFSNFKGIVLNKNSFILIIPILKWIIIFAAVLGLILFIAGKFASALVISIIGVIANTVFIAGLQYRDIYIISLYSMTLPLILCTFISMTGVLNAVPMLLFYVISGVYTWGAVRSCAITPPQ